MINSLTSLNSLDFCTKNFENIHLTCENSIKANKKHHYVVIFSVEHLFHDIFL